MLSFRVFEPKDTTEVLQLANAYGSFDMAITEADLSIAGSFENGFWVAEEEGKIVGFAYGYFKGVPGEVLERWSSSIVGEIALLVVDPAYRGRGIGTALIQRLTAEFKKAGADLIILHCPAKATEAKKLYDRLGFKVRAYHMGKRL